MTGRRSFTLVEALLALGLVAMLCGSLMSFIWMLGDRTRELDRRSRQEQGVSIVLDRLEADLLCGLAGGKGAGAGVKGDSTSVRVMSRGVGLALEDAGTTAAGDVQVGEYSFDAGAGRLRARRWGDGGTPPDLEAVAEQVRQVRVRYHDGKEWVDSFDSAARSALPAAIEVAVWYGVPKPADQEESTLKPAEPPPPDRVRLIVVPDGPVTALKEAS